VRNGIAGRAGFGGGKGTRKATDDSADDSVREKSQRGREKGCPIVVQRGDAAGVSDFSDFDKKYVALD
jgi:hypothetical protein